MKISFMLRNFIRDCATCLYSLNPGSKPEKNRPGYSFEVHFVTFFETFITF